MPLPRALKARRDRLILLVEHKMDVVRSLADRIVDVADKDALATARELIGTEGCLVGGSSGANGWDPEDATLAYYSKQEAQRGTKIEALREE